jgi:hypothetical protein
MRRRHWAYISLPRRTGSNPNLGIGTLFAEFFTEHMLLTLIRDLYGAPRSPIRLTAPG